MSAGCTVLLAAAMRLLALVGVENAAEAVSDCGRLCAVDCRDSGEDR